MQGSFQLRKAHMYSRRTFPLAILALLGSQGALADDFARRLVEAARKRTLRRETYDGSYRRIGYPLGDVQTSWACAPIS